MMANERIYNNIIEEEFQNYLKPLHSMQIITFQPKYMITNSFVTPNGKFFVLYSLIGSIILIVLNVYIHLKMYFTSTRYFYSLYYVLFTVFTIVSYLTFFLYGTKNAMNNVKLLLEIQEAHSLLKYHDEKLGKVKRFNSLYVLGFSIPVTVLLIVSNPSAFYNLTVYVTFIYFDIKLLDGYKMMQLLNYVTNCCQSELNSCLTKSVDNKNYVDGVINWTSIAKAHSHAIQAYVVFRRIFKLPILFIALYTFIGAVTNAQLLIEPLHNNPLLQISPLFMFWGVAVESLASTWIIKNLIFLYKVGHECGKLYDSLNKLDAICSIVIQKNVSVDSKQCCKNIRRMNSMYDKITPYSMFEVDAGLAFSVWELVATYVIVLLQFALNEVKPQTSNNIKDYFATNTSKLYES